MHWKTQQQCLFLAVMTWWAVSCRNDFLSTKLHTLSAESCVYLLINERLVLVIARNMKMNDILLSWAVTSAGSVVQSEPAVDAPLWHCSAVTLFVGVVCCERIVPTINCSQQGLRIILSNQIMISGKRHCCWVFQMYFFEALSRTGKV